MKSVILVEDELLARLGLKSLISWEEHGYRLVFEAENGRQALDFLQENPTDIVICDMKMPVMDGLEFIHEINKAHIHSQIIVTSAYDDFHYVKQALLDGACEYLLKSELNPSTLLRALEKASAKIAMQSLQSYAFTPGHLKLLQEDFLKNLFSGQVLPDAYIQAQQQLLNLWLPSGRFFCFSLNIVPPEGSGVDLEELKSTTEDVIESTLKNFGCIHIFLKSPDHALVMIQPHEELLSMPQNNFLERCTDGIIQMVGMLLNCLCYVGCSRVCRTVHELSAACHQACDAMEKAIFTKKQFVQYSNRRIDSGLAFNQILDAEIKDIEQALAEMNSRRLELSFKQLLHKIQLLTATDQKYLQAICHTLIFITNQNIGRVSNDISSIWEFDPVPYDTINSFESKWQYSRWIQQLSHTLLRVINPENENQRIILEAKKYIRLNYSANLSLDFMAEYLSISPNYFSKIFKKYTGTGFIDYLTDLRIKEADKLLKSGKYKIYEVSSMVGYDNPTYFSRIFKRKTGNSPYQVKTDINPD